MSDIKTLVALQDLDCRIRDMKRELEDIPARQKEEEARLELHKQNLNEAEEALKGKQAAVKQLEVEAGAVQDKINKLRQQQMQLKTNKEFKAMEHEIDAAQGEIGGLEDRELVLMDEVEAARLDVEARRKDLVDEEAGVSRDIAELQGRVSGLDTDIRQLEGERAGKVGEVAPEWLVHYERVLARRERALVPLVNGVCGGCHMTLPPSVRQNVMRQGDLVSCDHCGSLLYIP